MAQFYANIQGSRGGVTRTGTKGSGISGHIRGWNIGARVWVSHNVETGLDEVTIRVSSGSNGHKRDVNLGTFTINDLTD